MEQGGRGIYPKSFSWDCFLFPRVAEEGFLLPSGRRVSLRSPGLCPPGQSRAPNAPTGFGGQSRSFLLFVPQLLVSLSFPQGESLIKIYYSEFKPYEVKCSKRWKEPPAVADCFLTRELSRLPRLLRDLWSGHASGMRISAAGHSAGAR